MRFAILAVFVLLTAAFPAAAGWNDGYGSSDTYTPVTHDPAPTPPPIATQSYGGNNAATGPAKSAGAGHSFGSITCPQHVGCPDSGDSTGASDLAGYANSCITQYFGYKSDGGFIEESMSLSPDGCLTSKPNVIPKGMGAALTPHCCVVLVQEGTCALRCDMVAAQ